VKVAVVSTQIPFVRGGAELLAEWLTEKLDERGHEAELVRLPFSWSPPDRIIHHILATRLTRLRSADRVVAMKFPSYFVPHEDKVLWLLHQFRQAYELWGTPLQGFPAGPAGATVREAVVAADNAFLPEARSIYSNSSVTAARLKRFNDLDATVLHPPLRDESAYRCESFGDYVFFPSRISPTKRQELLVEALAYTTTDVRAVVAGSPDVPEYLERLQELVERDGLSDRVELIGDWISEERKLELYANALAVVYTPFDEDSYGYVTLESYQSGKPVITCHDSGGVLQLVENGISGFVVPSRPEALAEALDELADDRALAERLGEGGRENVERLQISWDAVVEALTT
jgi:glycosyltransferase involved in cell wall biosynthesis